jgi:glycosidase
MITFIENHDGLNRFRVAGISELRNRLAQGLVMTLPGIPCLYYGTEAAIIDDEAQIGWDAESGRKMFYRRAGGPSLEEVRNSTSFREISKLATLRARLPALRTGRLIPLWVDSPESSEDDGVFAFGRVSKDDKNFVVVVINASDEPRWTSAGMHVLKLPSDLKTDGLALRPALTIGASSKHDGTEIDAAGPLRLAVPATILVVFESVKAD